jgi:LysM repeat protein
MTPCTSRSAVIALIICMALPAWGQQHLLYVPQPVASGQKSASQNGILVQEVEVQKGDTLYGLSRKFSGHGMYFPQILLFNSIKNPNLIYPGSNLKVPVTQKEAHNSKRTVNNSAGAAHKPKASGDKTTPLKAETQPIISQSTNSSQSSRPSTEISLSDLKTVGTGKTRGRRLQKKNAVHAKNSQSHSSPALKRISLPLPAAHKSSAAAAPAVDSATGQKLFEAAVKAYRQDDCRTAIDLFERYLAANSSSPLAADAYLYKAECYLKLSAQ